jgi:hypothetical protein
LNLNKEETIFNLFYEFKKMIERTRCVCLDWFSKQLKIVKQAGFEPAIIEIYHNRHSELNDYRNDTKNEKVNYSKNVWINRIK